MIFKGQMPILFEQNEEAGIAFPFFAFLSFWGIGDTILF
jgi:hypothetical protein